MNPALLSQLWNIANQLTLFRLLVIPLILIAILYGRNGIALALFLVAAVTDGIDGLVARRFNQRTTLGAYLDPIADKLLLSSSFFVLALVHSVPWWLTILVLSRDVMILATSLVVVLSTQIRSFPPSILGKANTAVQVATVFCAVLQNAYPAGVLQSTLALLMWLTAGLTVASGVHYAARMSRKI
ncbi:MAG TPA: CDP-alcohol phosphatidyltransferase family protein [Bryobacterales bacterium]|nr:CDP-alcohol phosphatidyltransferase family protein [Bryobacterales bacterium]